MKHATEIRKMEETRIRTCEKLMKPEERLLRWEAEGSFGEEMLQLFQEVERSVEKEVRTQEEEAKREEAARLEECHQRFENDRRGRQDKK